MFEKKNMKNEIRKNKFLKQKIRYINLILKIKMILNEEQRVEIILFLLIWYFDDHFS
jgi:1-deoxy-D-xylulose 5-phosphate reductoisomerase